MKMADSSSRKRYIAILCFAAVAVLAEASFYARRKLRRRCNQTPISFNSS